MKNWKTTIFGILAAVGAAVAHYMSGSVAEIGTIISVAATALLGTSAGDGSNTGK